MLPVSAMSAGFLGVDLQCPGTFFWSAEPGLVLYGYERPDAYLESAVGINSPNSESSSDEKNRFHWRIRTKISYVFVGPQSFAALTEVQPKSTLQSPGLQQWALLANSKISTEIITNKNHSSAFWDTWGVEFWQSIPPQWRSIGALKHTQSAQLSGLRLTGTRADGPWRISSTIGFSSIAIEKTVFTLVHPTFELKYFVKGLP